MKNIFFIITLFFSSLLFSKELPELNRAVVDPYNYLTPNEKSEIDSTIRDYFSKTTNQIAVVLIDSLEGDNLESYALKIFDKWKLGDAKKDNGLLLLYVIKDRKMRTEVGRGLEGFMTDAESKTIQSSIKSELKNAQYGKAVLNQLLLTIHGIESNKNLEATALAKEKERQATSPVIREPLKIDWENVWATIISLAALSLLIGSVINSKTITKKKAEVVTLNDAKVKTENLIKESEIKIKELNLFAKNIYDKILNSFIKDIEDTEKSLSQVQNQISRRESEISELHNIKNKYVAKNERG